MPIVETPNSAHELLIPEELNFLAPLVVTDLIRIGRENDGGYGVPETLIREAEILVSMGINDDWSFDEECRKLNPDLRVHAYDFTISRQFFVKRLQMAMIGVCLGHTSLRVLRKRWHVLKSYDRFFRGPVRHFEERIYNRIDRPYDTTLSRVFERADSNKIVLKVDIEGSEYRIIDAIVEFADRIVGLIVEFHDTDPLRPVFVDGIRKLRQHFEIVHVHANNTEGIASDQLPELLEVTFVKRTRHQTLQRRTVLPLDGVDAPNIPGLPNYQMRFSA
ncbi:MAG: hypothetical protein ABSC65_30120 [Acidobacteriaceae bacterium]|jgi:hypothetical protein